MIGAAEMDRFLDHLPENVVVALDEAYFEYADWLARERGVDYSHSVDYVRQERSVLVLRSFSKAYGLAGARVGYGMGPAELINYLARLKTRVHRQQRRRGRSAGGARRPRALRKIHAQQLRATGNPHPVSARAGL